MARRTLSGRLVAIDLVERNCRAVEINSTGERVEVTGLATVTLPGRLEDISADAAGRALKQALEAAKISARQAVITIPRHVAILKPLVLPPLNPQELPAAVRLQAERELPYSPSEAHIDYAPTGIPLGDEAALGEKAPSGLGLLLGAVQHSVVSIRRAFLSSAGLSVRRMSLRPSASASAMVFAGIDTTDEFVALVDLGDQMTEINIVRSRFLVFSRSANIGSAGSAPVVPAEGGAAEPAAGRGGLSVFDRWQTALVGELRRTLEAFAVQPGGGPVVRLYLTGVGAQDESLAAAIVEALGIPVATFDPFERTALVGAVREAPREELSAYSAAFGMAASETDDLVPGFDFLVPLEERVRPAAKKRPYALAAGVVAGLAVLFGVPYGIYLSGQARLKAFQAKVAELGRAKEELKKLDDKSAALAPWADDDVRINWREAFETVTTDWPEQRRAYLTTLRLQRVTRTEEGKAQPFHEIILDGKAQNSTVVEELTEALKHDERFSKVEFRGQRFSPEDKSGYPVTFQVKVDWRGKSAASAAPATASRRSP